MNLLDHAKGMLSLFFITGNLALWLALAVPTRVIGWIVPGVAAPAERILRSIYLSAVRVDDFWLQRVLGVRWSMPDPVSLDAPGSWIVLSNHVSWADAFLIQSLLVRQGFVIQFLSKRELLWLPIVGLIVWTFEFPLLRRTAGRDGDESTRRRRDFEALREACRRARERPVALVCFAEGTRASAERRARLGGTYRHLLPPRAGGFGALCDGLGEALAGVVDCTLVYESAPAAHGPVFSRARVPHASGPLPAATRDVPREPNAITFWSLLSGRVGPIEVRARCWPAASIPLDRAARARWLEARWAEKDELIGRRASAR